MVNSIVISSRVRLARNISGLPFPNRLCDFESAVSVSKAVFNILGEDYEYRRLKNMTTSQYLMLLEDHTITKELIDNKDISGFARSADNTITIMINEEDHLKEQCVLDGFCLKECYEKINEIDDKILHSLDIAYSKTLGFLTACPTNVGTGMRASVVLFLPALTLNGVMKQLTEALSQKGFIVKGYNNENGGESYFYQISNKYTLGLSEQDIIDSLEKNVNNIVNMEEKARQTLLQINQDVIIDMSKRAYGVLTNSYILSSSECATMLSRLRFGVVLGIIKIKNASIIDELYVLSQQMHLEDYFSLELSKKEEDVFRAKFVCESLENKYIKGVR